MSDKNNDDYTSRKNASSFDKKFSKLASIKDAKHLCMRVILSELPDDASILCVGAGTGAELLYLAKEFPNWRFTVVEPAEAMMKICEEQAEAQGILTRCDFHEGYLDTLETEEEFDAATSVLVAHFLLKTEERYSYFREISSRLKDGGCLINVELSSDMETGSTANLIKAWRNMMEYSGLQNEDLEKVTSFEGVSILPQEDVEKIIMQSGFELPNLFYQAFFIHGWFTRKQS